jgi:hypothetical protein
MSYAEFATHAKDCKGTTDETKQERRAQSVRGSLAVNFAIRTQTYHLKRHDERIGALERQVEMLRQLVDTLEKQVNHRGIADVVRFFAFC